MVTIEKLNSAIGEAQRFIKKAKEAKKRLEEDEWLAGTGCKETAAVKRASMDLSRVLTELRR